MKIEIKNLVKSFVDKRAVDDISFAFTGGNIFGFIGPNGAGKTTTLKIMATLDIPDSGDVCYDGISAVEYPEKVRRVIGYMPDALPEHNDIRVWEYLDFFARAYGICGANRRRTLAAVEEFTNLGGLRDKFVKTLSKGMKQRVCLARALVHDPAVLIMDEPAAGLDPRARLELRELLKILAAQGKAVLLSSHILSELEDICDGAIIIEQGKLLSAGMLSEIGAADAAAPTTTTAIRLRSLDDPETLLRRVRELPLIVQARRDGETVIVEIVSHDEAQCFAVLEMLLQAGCRITRFEPEKLKLEQLFMNLTRGQVQ